jgi:hypothetical protein
MMTGDSIGGSGKKRLSRQGAEATLGIDPRVFDLCDSPMLSVGGCAADKGADSMQEESDRNDSPKSDGIPTEPITPMIRPAKTGSVRPVAVFDMPEVLPLVAQSGGPSAATGRSVEDQLVKSSQLMDTILSTPFPSNHAWIADVLVCRFNEA